MEGITTKYGVGNLIWILHKNVIKQCKVLEVEVFANKERLTIGYGTSCCVCNIAEHECFDSKQALLDKLIKTAVEYKEEKEEEEE